MNTIIGQAGTRRGLCRHPRGQVPVRLPAPPKSATTGLRLEGTHKWTDTLEGWEGRREPSQRGGTPRAVGSVSPKEPPGSVLSLQGKCSLVQGNWDFTLGTHQLPHLRKGIPSSWHNHEINVARCNLKALCSWLSTAIDYVFSQKARGRDVR